MGILKNHDDNLEEENQTFFFDGSKKLYEFVNNKDIRNPVSSDGRDIDGRIHIHSGSDQQIPSQCQNDNASSSISTPLGMNSIEKSSIRSNVGAGSSGIENSATNPSSSSSSNSTSK